MQVSLDGVEVELPDAADLGELLDGIAPLIDPGRLVTSVEVDGAPADGTDRAALGRWRLAAGQRVSIGTEAPADFAATRRREIPDHLRRIADLLAAVAAGFAAGDESAANQVLVMAVRELVLVLELDDRLGVLDAAGPCCAAVAETVRRIGQRLTDAERERRWPEVARLLSEELVPSLRGAA